MASSQINQVSISGTSAERLARYPAGRIPGNTIFFETDTQLAFAAINGAWVQFGSGSASVSAAQMNFVQQVTTLVSTEQTSFLADGGAGSEATLIPQNIPVANSITADALIVNTELTLTGSDSIVVTLIVNGVPTALSVSFAAGDGNNVPKRVTGSQILSIGDLIDMQVVTNGFNEPVPIIVSASLGYH